jgi:hypothetical protein
MDEEKPYLWSDDEIWTYMNEAQMRFCRDAEGISDFTTPEVVNIPVTTGEVTAKSHCSILNFRLALLASTGCKLDIINYTDVQSWATNSGRVSSIIIGMQEGKVRWNATPIADDEVNLIVFRLPLSEITGPDQEIEIDKKHHVGLVHWMKHLAYLKDDTEVFDKDASEKAKGMFAQYCEKVSSEQRRYRQKPRAVFYGGI